MKPVMVSQMPCDNGTYYANIYHVGRPDGGVSKREMNIEADHVVADSEAEFYTYSSIHCIPLDGFPRLAHESICSRKILVNGQVIENTPKLHAWQLLNSKLLTFPVPANVLKSGVNTVTFEINSEDKVAHFMTIKNYGLRYTRSLVARNDALKFENQSETHRIAGFSDDNIVAYAYKGSGANGRLIRIKESVTRLEDGSYEVRTSSRPRDKSIWISTESALLVPVVVATPKPDDLLDYLVDYVIISHPAFIGEASDTGHPLNRYVDAKTSGGYNIKVVNVDDIYTSYGHGMALPEAISTYLREALETTLLKHVLLVGNSSPNPYNYGGGHTPNYIPTTYDRTQRLSGIQRAPSDMAYMDPNNDGVVDLAVGRWPVIHITDTYTTTFLSRLVDKSLHFTSLAPAREKRALYVADSMLKTSPKQNNYAEYIRNLIQRTQYSEGVDSTDLVKWNQESLYLDDYFETDPTNGNAMLKSDMLNAINDGVSMMFYQGHGAGSSVGFGGGKPVMSTRDLGSMTNTDTPFIINFLTCYSSPTSSKRLSLDMGLLYVTSGGAAAVLGPGGLSIPTDADVVGRTHTQEFYKQGTTLGQALVKAHNKLRPKGFSGALNTWRLLGDPTITLN